MFSNNDYLHPVGPLRDRINDQFLILRSPFSHLAAGMDNKRDIVNDILPLAVLVMKRHSMRCQRLESLFDIGLGTASYADAKIRMTRLDKVLYKVKDAIAWRYYSRGTGTLIEGIYDEIYRGLIGES